jgi:hypothetical protein
MDESWIMRLLCLVVALCGIFVAGWALVTRQVEKQGLDAVFLIAISLLFTVMFAPIPVNAIRKESWRALLPRKRE